MLQKFPCTMIYTVTFLTLVAVDYFLGYGFVEICQKMFCRFVCFIRKSIREEEKQAQIVPEVGTVSLSVMLTEILLLGFTIVFLNKYKLRCKDRIDNLLQESREMLRQTNEFLEKWRMRRMNMHLQEYSYLDEEPQEIKPYKLEVPILHMAIIDTLGAARNQPESGDAGDLISYTDSALLSMTSLIDDDLDSIYSIGETVGVSNSRGRVLWDVMEEDGRSNFED